MGLHGSTAHTNQDLVELIETRSAQRTVVGLEQRTQSRAKIQKCKTMQAQLACFEQRAHEDSRHD